MAMLEQQADWNEFVHEAVDRLLTDLAKQESLPFGEADIESSIVVRERLVSYSMSLLAAASAGTANLRCNDGSSTVDCAFVLRPNDTPYYRCVHSPPDCYDVNHQTIACP